MTLADQQIENPNPIEAHASVRCKHCQHFRDTPYYKIDGAYTVCSNPAIGRSPNQIPCPHFATNMSTYRRLSGTAKDLIDELLTEIGADAHATRGRKVDHVRDAEAIDELSIVLRSLAAAHKRGYTYGTHYTVAGLTDPGTLLALTRTRAVVEVKGIPYTVDLDKLSPWTPESAMERVA